MTEPSSTATATTAIPTSMWAAGAGVLGSRWWLLGFAVTAAIVGLAYTILLPFDATGRFSLANWRYLTPALIAWSVILGLGMAFVLLIQVHAIRQLAARRSTVAVSGLAFVGGLLPSLLCCSPLLPTLLTFVGLSTAQVYGTTGAWQYFFAAHQTAFLAGSLLLLLLTAGWGLRRIARNACVSEQGCPTPEDTPETERRPR